MRDTSGLIPGSTGKPAGTLRARPTAKQLDTYRRQLRAKAESGDTLALGFIVLCDTLKAGEAR